MMTVSGKADGKVIGYMKIKDQEFLLRESHVANLAERLFMYRLLMGIGKEAAAEDPKANVPVWKLRRMLIWGVILKPNSKACSYEKIVNEVTEEP